MRISSALRACALPSAISLLCGLVLGIVPPLLAGDGGPVRQAAHIALSGGWPWAALAFFVGTAQRTRIQSAALAALSLCTAVTAYYATKATHDIRGSNLGDPAARLVSEPFDWGALAFWGICACLLGSLLGWAGNLARERGMWGLLSRLLIPAISLVETTARLRVEAPSGPPIMAMTWGLTRGLAVAAATGLIAHAVIGRLRTRRPAES
ncbi:DUF6518 family protein [Streptomyces sp. NRRL F-4489]|uniref:DUF6518 family protein n=1 Tax=Streptomyces sp. NRRL F-4489 TaxID=1609095 RepID=UPI003B631E8D